MDKSVVTLANLNLKSNLRPLRSTLLPCLKLVVSETYSESNAAPSASTTRLVSSLEICSASARCMSVMVQKDATRWSGEHSMRQNVRNHFHCLMVQLIEQNYSMHTVLKDRSHLFML